MKVTLLNPCIFKFSLIMCAWLTPSFKKPHYLEDSKEMMVQTKSCEAFEVLWDIADWLESPVSEYPTSVALSTCVSDSVHMEWILLVLHSPLDFCHVWIPQIINCWSPKPETEIMAKEASPYFSFVNAGGAE